MKFDLKAFSLIELIQLRKKTIESFRKYQDNSDAKFIKTIDDELEKRQNNISNNK